MSGAVLSSGRASVPVWTRWLGGKRGNWLLWTPAALYLLVFFVLPLIGNARLSLTVASGPGWSFAHYAKLFGDPFYFEIIMRTLWVSLVTTLICLAIGYPTAYFLVRRAGRLAPLMIFFLIAPLLTSIIMRTFGWRVLLARKGLVSTWLLDLGVIDRPLDLLNQPVAVYLGLVHVLVPFMVLSIAPVLQVIDRGLEESARVLGANGLQTFLKVTLPLSLDGIATGAILVFMLTNGSFLTMLLLGGGTVVTLPLMIYQQFNLTQDVAFAAAMGNTLLCFALICLFLQIRLIRRRGVGR
ncbi:putative spermidine/putrescine transport system permease protein [Rhizobiales bacterium GAS113]|nr:putative spermidine/putrescine transport system permease protein [Rhizobiales bacterium GAS113]